ncbi:MAG: diacylglycerol kinase, partial [Croceibacterium sp.]
MNHPIKTFDSLPQALRVAVPLSGSEPRAVPLVGVIRNPRSFRNKGVTPDRAAQAEVITETTFKRKELFEVLARFAGAGIDFLAIDGGDGTVRDVLTCGASVFGDDWPPLILM